MLQNLLYVHVGFGMLALLVGLMVFFIKKGTPLHTKLGTGYALAMTLVFVTATIISIQKQYWFLLLVGFFSFFLVHTGVRYNKVRSPESSTMVDKLTTLFYGICFLAMVALTGYAFYHGIHGLGIILSVFSTIGILLLKDDVRYFLQNKEAKKNHWMKEHIGRMIGSYIAAVTAFAVNNIEFQPGYIVWLAPTVLGIPLIFLYNRRYKL